MCISNVKTFSAQKLLPPLPKVDGGYVFTHLFVFGQDVSKSYGWIWTKLGGRVRCVTRTNWFDFREVPDPDSDTRINYLRDSSPLRDSAKNYTHSKISQYVMDGLWQNLVDEFGRWQEQADSILVQIWMQIRPISGSPCVGVGTRPGLCPIAKETASAAPTLCTEYGPDGWMDGNGVFTINYHCLLSFARYHLRPSGRCTTHATSVHHELI